MIPSIWFNPNAETRNMKKTYPHTSITSQMCSFLETCVHCYETDHIRQTHMFSVVRIVLLFATTGVAHPVEHEPPCLSGMDCTVGSHECVPRLQYWKVPLGATVSTVCMAVTTRRHQVLQRLKGEGERKERSLRKHVKTYCKTFSQTLTKHVTCQEQVAQPLSL